MIFMSDLLSELSLSVANLQTASDAAVRALDLVPGGFAWFTAEVRHAMPLQRIIPDSDLEHDSYASSVTYYGGGAVHANGNFSCGHIQASIPEHLADGTMHQSGHSSLPHPYIGRLLTVNAGVVTVDTPSVEHAASDGPVVAEGLGYNDRYRVVTLYDIGTGKVTVKHGKLITDGHALGSMGYSRDETVETDAAELPTDIVESRLGIMLRTVKGAAQLFDRIAKGQIGQMKLNITRTARNG